MNIIRKCILSIIAQLCITERVAGVLACDNSFCYEYFPQKYYKIKQIKSKKICSYSSQYIWQIHKNDFNN